MVVVGMGWGVSQSATSPGELKMSRAGPDNAITAPFELLSAVDDCTIKRNPA